MSSERGTFSNQQQDAKDEGDAENVQKSRTSEGKYKMRTIQKRREEKRIPPVVLWDSSVGLVFRCIRWLTSLS